MDSEENMDIELKVLMFTVINFFQEPNMHLQKSFFLMPLLNVEPRGFAYNRYFHPLFYFKNLILSGF